MAISFSAALNVQPKGIHNGSLLIKDRDQKTACLLDVATVLFCTVVVVDSHIHSVLSSLRLKKLR